MRILERGTLLSEKIYIGSCSHCKSLVEATHNELTHTFDQRDGEFHVGDCPVCKVSRIYFGESK